MASIPVGEFGQTVAAPQRAFTVSPAAFGGAAAQGLVEGARAVEQDAVVAARQDQIEARQAQAQQRAEARARARQQAAEAKQLQAENQRVQALTARVEFKNALREAGALWQQGIASGQIRPDGAADLFGKEVQALRDERLQRLADLPEAARSLVQLEMDDDIAQARFGLGGAVLKREQSVAAAQLGALREQYERSGVSDPRTAFAEYGRVLREIGPRTGMTAEQIAVDEQRFRERVTAVRATTLVDGSQASMSQVRQARQALATDEFAALDPAVRQRLTAELSSAEVRIAQRAEIEAQRAARVAEARSREAERAFGAARAMIDAGLPLSEAEGRRLMAAMQGSPYLAAFNAMQDQARAVGGFAAQPLAAQANALREVDAQLAREGASEALLKRREQLSKVYEAGRRAVDEDPLSAALQRGVVSNLPMLDPGNPQSWQQSIGQRVQAARVAAQWAGRPVSPLTAAEAEQFSRTVNALQPAERAQALRLVVNGVQDGAALSGLAAQIAPKDEGMAGALKLLSMGAATTRGRSPVDLYFAGAQAKASGVIRPADVAADEQEIARRLQGVYMTATGERVATTLAKGVLAGARAAGESMSPDGAIRLVTGGLVNQAGAPTVIPYGWDENRFSRGVRAVNESLVREQGGEQFRAGQQVMSAAELAAAIPRARLVAIDNNRYSVQIGAMPVMDAQGRPFQLRLPDVR